MSPEVEGMIASLLEMTAKSGIAVVIISYEKGQPIFVGQNMGGDQVIVENFLKDVVEVMHSGSVGKKSLSLPS